MRIPHAVKKQSGFTLIEMIITIAMFSILSLAVTSTIIQFYRSNAHAITQTLEVQGGWRNLKAAVQDIREIAYADDGAFPLVSASANTFTFYSDVDQDNSTELISYTLSGTTFEKELTDASGNPPTYSDTPNESTVISTYVRNISEGVPIFQYYDNSGVLIDGSDVTEIASVEITIMVDIDVNADPDAFTLGSRVTFRNLKDNL